MSDVPSPVSQSDGGSAPSTPRPTTPPTPERCESSRWHESSCIRSCTLLDIFDNSHVLVSTGSYRLTLWGWWEWRWLSLPRPSLSSLNYCRISELCDWSSDDIIGKSIYDLCHPGDLQQMKKTHKDLITKGQVLSDYFRMINRNGGYVWAQVCASTLYSSKTSDVHTVLTIVYILSGVEYENCVMDTCQLPKSIKLEMEQTSSHNDMSIMRDQIKDQEESRHTTSPGSVKMECHPPPESPDEPSRKKRPLSNGSEIEDLQVSPRTDHKSPSAFASQDNEVLETSNSTSTMKMKMNCSKVLYKNSRRKMDKPRKRQRGSIDSQSLMFPDSFGQEISNSSDSIQRRLSCASLLHDNNSVSPPINGYHSHSESPKCLEDYSMPAPEDLSLRSPNTRQDTLTNIQRKNCWQSSSGVDQNDNCSMSSVKFLEDVMNKHLPNLSQLTNHDNKPTSATMSNVVTSNAATNSLNKQQSQIQWTGSETVIHPASNLLRTLHAKRESVIRSSNTSRSFPVESTTINMLTPPGNDGLKEQLTLNIPQISVNAKGSVLPSYTSTSHMTVSTASESFNMTPPSSVSPTEKLVSPFGMEGSFDPGVCSSLTHVTSSPVTQKSQTFPLAVATATSDFNCIKTTGYNNISPEYHAIEYPHFSHSQSSFLSYDLRPDTWYPVSFQS